MADRVTKLKSVVGIPAALGQTTASASMPVVLASDQPAIPITTVIPGTAATNLGKAVGSAAGATDTGVAGLVIRDDALTTLSPADGSYTHQRVDSLGNTWTTLGTKIRGENESLDRMMTLEANNITRITTATTTTVLSGAGSLNGIFIGTTAAGTITVYDNTAGSGTIIAVFKASMPEGYYRLPVTVATGITIVTAAASDISVFFDS